MSNLRSDFIYGYLGHLFGCTVYCDSDGVHKGTRKTSGSFFKAPETYTVKYDCDVTMFGFEFTYKFSDLPDRGKYATITVAYYNGVGDIVDKDIFKEAGPFENMKTYYLCKKSHWMVNKKKYAKIISLELELFNGSVLTWFSEQDPKEGRACVRDEFGQLA